VIVLDELSWVSRVLPANRHNIG